MISAAPSGSYTAFLPLGITGFAASIGFTVYTAAGAVQVARVVGTGITEIGTTGTYRKTTTAPATAATFLVQWDYPSNTAGNVFPEELVVATGGGIVDLSPIIARLAKLGAVAIPAIDPVDASGNTTLYKGDSYLQAFGRELVYHIPDAIDLTLASTVTWRVEGQTPDLAVAMTVLDADTAYVELTSAQTVNLAPTGGSPITFEIDALLTTGETSTVKRALLTVQPDLAA